MAAKDRFQGREEALGDPSGHAEPVTPSDTAELPLLTKALYVGTGGDVTVTMSDGSDVLFKTVPSGATLNLRVRRVKQAGTGASNIVALF